MKKFLFFCICLATMFFCSSCRNASKYADDVLKYADDTFEKVSKKGVKVKKVPKVEEQICTNCNGLGRVYDINGYQYVCSNCNGDGKVMSIKR